MLSQLLFVRLKAAENALRDGRLEEAYRLATAADVREHRRGAAVLASLTERFTERARNHYRADRFTEALMDLDRADAGGVMKEELAELRQQVHTVMGEVRRRENARDQRVDEARRRIEGGSLAAGRRILEHASQENAAVERLRHEAEKRMGDLQQTVEQAEQLLGHGQFAAAAERVVRAKRVDAHHAAVAGVEARLCSAVLESAKRSIVEGRLTRAADELACLGSLGADSPERREVETLLNLAERAAKCLAGGDPGEARAHVMSLQRLAGKTNWVADALEQLQKWDEIQTALRAGPLGSMMTTTGAANGREVVRLAATPGAARVVADVVGRERGKPRRFDDTIALPSKEAIGGNGHSALLLLVDGGGSFLLLKPNRVGIGRAAADNPAEIPLIGDVAERHAFIERVDDDYFLFSSKEVEVGGRSVQSHLLKDQDRVVLGKKAKFMFRVPSRKCASAVLDLSDTTKMPNDVRRVVLFRQMATMGEGPHAHVRCRHAGPPLLLFERNGELWVRQQNDGRVDTAAQAVAIGKPVEIAGASFVVQPWRVQIPGSGTV